MQLLGNLFFFVKKRVLLLLHMATIVVTKEITFTVHNHGLYESNKYTKNSQSVQRRITPKRSNSRKPILPSLNSSLTQDSTKLWSSTAFYLGTRKYLIEGRSYDTKPHLILLKPRAKIGMLKVLPTHLSFPLQTSWHFILLNKFMHTIFIITKHTWKNLVKKMSG